MQKEIKGKINSFESLGAVDGPGLRFVIFSQGCPLRCGCCHNPDTWDTNGGEEYLASEIVNKALRFKNYWQNGGGVTVSGGEPLLQADFFLEVFTLLKEKGISTCLDTSGYAINESVKALLEKTDVVLLDIKYTSEELYKKHVGCSLKKVIEFLEYLNAKSVPTIVRQVIIKGLNDNKENVLSLKALKEKYSCVQKIELLPFRKICKAKYDNLGLDFAFRNIEETDIVTIKNLEALIN